MSFLIHLDTCAAYVKNIPRFTSRMQQHRGALHVSAVTLMGLALWLLRPKTPARYSQGYIAVTQQMKVLSVDEPTAARAAFLGARLRGQKPHLNSIDLLVTATALEHGLTLVTHDVQHYAHVPALTVVDWLVP